MWREPASHPHRRRRLLTATALPAVLLVSGLAACLPKIDCQKATVTTSTVPDTGWTERLHVYSDNASRTDDMTGADGAHSTLLPDGRRAWAFGDTFLGTIDANHGRPLNTPMVSNTYVEESGGTFSRTVTGVTSTGRTALLRPSTTGSFYWPADAVVEGSKLRVLVNEWSGTGLDLTHKGAGFVTLNLPGLTVDTAAPRQMALRGGVLYDSILAESSWTYFYGMKGRELYVARVPVGKALDPWTYWTGSAWASDPSQASPVTATGGGVQSPKVAKVGGCFVLLSFQPGVFFPTADIRAYVADAPEGPWTAGQYVHTIPEASRTDVYWYGAWQQPSLRSGTSVVTAYSINAWGDGNHTDVHRYRVRFLKITFTGLPS
jgi:hypothetical protein